jgi:hypothetical protein
MGKSIKKNKTVYLTQGKSWNGELINERKSMSKSMITVGTECVLWWAMMGNRMMQNQLNNSALHNSRDLQNWLKWVEEMKLLKWQHKSMIRPTNHPGREWDQCQRERFWGIGSRNLRSGLKSHETLELEGDRGISLTNELRGRAKLISKVEMKTITAGSTFGRERIERK